jgi:hypothetical protein
MTESGRSDSFGPAPHASPFTPAEIVSDVSYRLASTRPRATGSPRVRARKERLNFAKPLNMGRTAPDTGLTAERDYSVEVRLCQHDVQMSIRTTLLRAEEQVAHFWRVGRNARIQQAPVKLVRTLQSIDHAAWVWYDTMRSKWRGLNLEIEVRDAAHNTAPVSQMTRRIDLRPLKQRVSSIQLRAHLQRRRTTVAVSKVTQEQPSWSADEYHARHSEEGLQRRRVRLSFTRSNIFTRPTSHAAYFLVSDSARSVGVAALLR